MPRSNCPPSYRHYTPKNLAVVRIKGKDHYVGKYDSPESWREYYRLIADHLAPAQRLNLVHEEGQPKPPPLKVKKLCLLYSEFAAAEYVKDGKPTGEVPCIKHPLQRLIKLFADKPAAELGPKALKMVRDEYVRDGLTRNTVNNNVARIKRMYRWAVASRPASFGWQVRRRRVDSLLSYPDREIGLSHFLVGSLVHSIRLAARHRPVSRLLSHDAWLTLARAEENCHVREPEGRQEQDRCRRSQEQPGNAK